MKNLFLIIGAAFILLSCGKDAAVEPQQSSVSTSDRASRKAAKADNQGIQTLIRK